MFYLFERDTESSHSLVHTPQVLTVIKDGPGWCQELGFQPRYIERHQQPKPSLPPERLASAGSWNQEVSARNEKWIWNAAISNGSQAVGSGPICIPCFFPSLQNNNNIFFLYEFTKKFNMWTFTRSQLNNLGPVLKAPLEQRTFSAWPPS